MKRKLYILFFTLEGFDQIGEETDGDDVDPDEDNHEVNDEEQGGEEEGDDMGEDGEDEAIDEIDKANFQSKNLENGSDNKCVQVGDVCAANFHPHILLDEMHENFVEETREKLPQEGMLDLETDMGKELDWDMGSPICTSDVPMSVHLDYCSEQLRKIDMMESNEEEEDVMPEMQCLAKEICTVLGSTKRSLLDTLEKEAGQKKKINAGKDGRWGPVLSNKPWTREHGGGVKIMDKAAAYMQKKNLEIPANFKGPILEKCKMHSCKAGHLSKSMEDIVHRCSANSSAGLHQIVEQDTWGIASDCVEMMLGGHMGAE
uniref:Uncharacterized protein n=1 Tax=Hordeum vulgare subsp. vulgare TaxID=112509 RepID=A0A8I7BB88_HORVV